MAAPLPLPGSIMTDPTLAPKRPTDLRQRAHARLNRPGETEGVRLGAAAALGVLHELASSPATAADALAVLHELQVHQVELDLQAEELSNSRAELEAALARQLLLYEHSPAALFTIDRRTLLHETNRTGAVLLGVERDGLLGRPLEAFVTPAGARALDAMLERIAAGAHAEACTMELQAGGAAPRVVQVRVQPDPAGGRFLVAFMDMRGER